MMKNKLTKALIYESQGLKTDAMRVYSEILEFDPENKDAIDGLKRLEISKNDEMLELFFSQNPKDIDEFKRWLVEL